MTPSIETVVVALDAVFKEAGFGAIVTSGLRTPEHQLDVIKQLARDYGIERIFPSITSATLTGKMIFEGQQVFQWQPAWSALLHNNIIVNPPLVAKCLMDYVQKGINKKGQLINQTPHSKGTAFDIGGANRLDKIIAVLERAYESRKISGWLGYKVERLNNAIHCDCKLIDLAV